MCGSVDVLRWLVLASAVLQLVGTALVVWGLRITSSESAYEGHAGGDERPFAVVWKAHPLAFAVGLVLLLAGLLLQVIVALL